LKEIYDILREFEKRRGESFALATLVCAEGSSYRRPGRADVAKANDSPRRFSNSRRIS